MDSVESVTARAAATGISFGPTVAAGTGDLPQGAPDGDATTLSFGDFLDMINPLQHIPVVSSIYRTATGDDIKPVARIAGDSLYGAALGVATGGIAIAASAGMAAIGAVADEAYTANNKGESATGTVMAALFGNDADAPVQVADNKTAATPSTTAQAMQVAAATPALGTIPLPATADAKNTTPLSPAEQIAALQAAAGKNIQAGLPLDRSKMAYGGVMDPALTEHAAENQTAALAMASGDGKMQAQHALRNSRFATSHAQTVTNATPQSAALPLPGDATSIAQMLSGGSINPAAGILGSAGKGAGGASLPANMVQNMGFAQAQSTLQGLPKAGLSSDLQAIKGLDQYRRTALSSAAGSTVDITN